MYENGLLSYLNYYEGRILFNSAGVKTPEFFLKDKLVNVRVTFTVVSGKVLIGQVNAYYPYGAPIKALTTNYTTDHKNKYLYQGKEMQDEHGVNWLDFGARMYDANLGRWFAPDPMLEDPSPYVAMGNNPVRFTDPTGMRRQGPLYYISSNSRLRAEMGYMQQQMDAQLDRNRESFDEWCEMTGHNI